jgi:hypothetical protein
MKPAAKATAKPSESKAAAREVFAAQRPSMGRIVLYQGCPALIQHVFEDGLVDLAVFGVSGLRMEEKVAEGGDGWSWPPRV